MSRVCDHNTRFAVTSRGKSGAHRESGVSRCTCVAVEAVLIKTLHRPHYKAGHGHYYWDEYRLGFLSIYTVRNAGKISNVIFNFSFHLHFRMSCCWAYPKLCTS